MRKPAILLIATGILLCLALSCSESPVDSNPDSQKAAIVLTPRPEFVDIRPAEVIQSYLIAPSQQFVDALEKKPPKPPPDTGSQDPNPNPAHKYAYIVGISDYDGTVNDLNFCDDDAQAMKSYLQGQGFTVQMDLDQSATADNIQAGLQWLEAQAAAGDEIAFCYSGHGTKYPGYGSCIISTDMYYMTHGFVMQYINSAACTKKLVTLDACVIGDFHLDCQAGTFMATASTNSDSYDVYAFEHGAWTYFFLEALNDLNYVYAEEVAPYAEAEMKAWAKPYHLRVSPAHTDAYEGMF
ncbi:MAG TPA: caspase family protein, partial [candidate division Zixibacteria bacterium]|nr:caspase family protein [candidate division Zixibacteria bacterium]